MNIESILTAALIISLLFGLFLVMRRKRKISKRDREFIELNWNRILERATQNPRDAILEADKLLHFALTKMGLDGSLGDMMKRWDKMFVHTNEIWNAHKLRNRIAHEIGFMPSAHQTEKALNAYERELLKFL